jgi:hypothetical protein
MISTQQLLEQPLSPVTVTVYLPACLMSTHAEVSPVFHKYETEFAGAHNKVDFPFSIVVLPVIKQLGA